MARKPKAKTDIDVVPYLSIMVIVLKLITLILIVQVIPIALNPERYKILAFEELFTSRKQHAGPVKVPTYFDCGPDQVEIIPGRKIVSYRELREPGNPVERTVEKLAQNAEKEYAILIVRPHSLPVYRHLRRTLGSYAALEVGYDVLEAGRTIDWEAEARKARIEDF